MARVAHPAVTAPLGARARLHAMPVLLVASAVLAGLLALAVYGAFVRTRAGQQLDLDVLVRLRHTLRFTRTDSARSVVLALVAVAAAALGVVALVARRWRATTASAVAVVVTAALAEALKAALPRPYLGDYAYTDNTYPSAHAAITTALCLACVVLWPRPSSRPVALVVAAAVVAAQGLYNVTGFAHRPSDVAGGVLVALAVWSLVLAVAGYSQTLGPPVRRATSEGLS